LPHEETVLSEENLRREEEPQPKEVSPLKVDNNEETQSPLEDDTISEESKSDLLNLEDEDDHLSQEEDVLSQRSRTETEHPNGETDYKVSGGAVEQVEEKRLEAQGQLEEKA